MNKNAHILKEARKKAEKEIKGMVVIMGNDALNHYEGSFRNQGFTDESLVGWKKRKRTERSRGGNRAILTKTGRLRRSLKRMKIGQYAIKITSNVPYANIHNEGIGRMPKRQFVGYSGKLNRSLIKKFDSKIQSIFR